MSPPMYSQGASTITNYTYSAMGVLTSVVRDGQTIHSQTISGNNFHANPCNWRNNVLQWTRGRQLASYGSIASYRYDASGIRLEKTVGSTLHRYYTEGSRIHKETRGNNTLWYYYDGTGIIGMDYNGTRYYFHKNIQGDIVRILTDNGDVVGSYTYDAWGNHTIGINTNGIADINPFRYRGYYYDTETGLYYLQSRYYDPTMYRFINADDVDVLHGYSTTLNGLNLFSYCINNPVMHTDPTGHAIGLIIGIIVGAVGLVFGADAIIQTVGDYKRNPTAASIFAIILAVAFFVLDLFFFVSEVIAAVRALKAVDAVVDTAKVADGASDVIDTTSDLANKKPKSISSERRSAVNKAWKQEQDLLKAGKSGTRSWTDLEIDEIIKTGKVKGYQGHHINSVKGSPQLAGNPNNIAFFNRVDHLAQHHGNFQNVTYGELIDRIALLFI